MPVIRTREASSVVRLREGETFVLSGLNYSNKSEFNAGVPGLSKIPLLGKLFQQNKLGQNQDTEICIFLTPTVVKLKSDSSDLTTKPATTVETKPKINNNPETNSVTDQPIVLPPATTQAKNEEIPKSEPSATVSNSTSNNVTVPIKPSDSVTSEVNKTPNLAVPTLPTTSSQTPTAIEPVPNQSSVASQPVAPPKDQVSVTLTDSAQKPSSDTEVKLNPVDLSLGLKVNLRVQKGNTISMIAKKYGVPVESIQKENNIKSGAVLKEGQALTIPIPKDHLYQLKAKETLWRIAKRYGTTVEVLKDLNKITDVSKLEVGQVIILPTKVDKIVDHTL